MSPRAEWMVTWPPAQAVFPLVQGFLPSLSTSVSQEEASFFLPYRTGDTKHKRRFCVFTCWYLNLSKCAVPRCMLVLTELSSDRHLDTRLKSEDLKRVWSFTLDSFPIIL